MILKRIKYIAHDKIFEYAINCIIAYGVVIDFATKLKDTMKEKYIICQGFRKVAKDLDKAC